MDVRNVSTNLSLTAVEFGESSIVLPQEVLRIPGTGDLVAYQSVLISLSLLFMNPDYVQITSFLYLNPRELLAESFK